MNLVMRHAGSLRKEKLLAAHRAGLKRIIFPRDNERDLAEIPANIQQELTLCPVESMDEDLRLALDGHLPELDTPMELFTPVAERELEQGSVTN